VVGFPVNTGFPGSRGKEPGFPATFHQIQRLR
jgi:hypothetical protein